MFESKSIIPLNVWTHINASYDGIKAKIYINGVLDSELLTGSGCDVRDSSGAYYIGDNPTRRFEGGTPFQGRIDEVRIYNRTLADTEIMELSVSPADVLGGFVDLKQSKINYADNTITLKFTKSKAQLPQFFDRITVSFGSSKVFQYEVANIQAGLQTDSTITLSLIDQANVSYSLKDYPNNLIKLDFEQSTLGIYKVKSTLLGSSDQLRYFAPDSIINSRTVADTKPTSANVCTNQQGISSPCNNFFNSTENGANPSKIAVFRETLSHRLVDFDKVLPASQINNTWANAGYGKAPKNDNGRLPLLLIHGWQGDKDMRNPAKLGLLENSELQYWQHFLDYYLATPNLQSKYHVYLYHYPSYKHVTYNANVLTAMLKELATKKPTSDLNQAMLTSGKGVVVLAHSMGGLVARSAIEEYQAFGASGEKLRRLITLDTPHHGSPVSQPANWKIAELKQKLVQTIFKDPYTQGASDLHWDNFNGFYAASVVNDNNTYRWDAAQINNQAFDKAYWDVCNTNVICKYYGTENPWLRWMNANFSPLTYNPYTNKYTLYAGWMLNMDSSQTSAVDNTIIRNGLAFNQANAVLTKIAQIPSGGAEPVNSALWDTDDSVHLFALNGYNNESPFYANCDATGKTPMVATQWFGEGFSYQKIINDMPYFVCGNSILITKSDKLSDSNLNHPLGFQFRVFWDYSHENMVNGAYPSGRIGYWDKYIEQGTYLDSSLAPYNDSAFKRGLANIDKKAVKQNYVSIAQGYRLGDTSLFTKLNKFNASLYNPLTFEPLFNVLEGDLNKISNDSTN